MITTCIKLIVSPEYNLLNYFNKIKYYFVTLFLPLVAYCKLHIFFKSNYMFFLSINLFNYYMHKNIKIIKKLIVYEIFYILFQNMPE